MEKIRDRRFLNFLLYRNRAFNKKNIILIVLIFFLTVIYIMPLRTFGNQANYHKISPYIYPYLLTDISYLVALMAGVVYYFSDLPFVSGWNNYYVLRVGRKKWISKQIIYIVISSVIMTVINILLPFVILLPYTEVGSGWGKVLTTLAKTDAGQQCGLFWKISFQYMSNNTPVQAMIASFIMSVLCMIFVGTFILAVSLITCKTIGIIGISVMIMYVPITVSVGELFQRDVSRLSPISWIRVANYGITNYGYEVFPAYVYTLCGYFALIVGLIGLIYWKVGNIDLKFKEGKLK